MQFGYIGIVYGIDEQMGITDKASQDCSAIFLLFSECKDKMCRYCLKSRMIKNPVVLLFFCSALKALLFHITQKQLHVRSKHKAFKTYTVGRSLEYQLDSIFSLHILFVHADNNLLRLGLQKETRVFFISSHLLTFRPIIDVRHQPS